MTDLIKYEGSNSFFVWKHPIEDFSYGTQLIVHESQEALFFSAGQALDLFTAGTYSLTTEKVPLLNRLFPQKGNNQPFHSEVYFINMAVHTGIKWGTSSRIRFFDPMSGMHVNIGLSGQFNLRVCNSKKLILKLVGTTEELVHKHELENAEGDSRAVFQFIRAIIVTKARTSFATIIKEKGWSILEIDAYAEELADVMKEAINQELENYGLTMPEFYILNISTPEDSDNKQEREDYLRMKQQFGDKYLRVKEEEIKEAEALAAQRRKIIEAQTEAQIKMIQSQSEAESSKMLGFAEAEIQKAQGYTGKDKLQYEVQKTFAENINSAGGSSAMGDLLSFGVGMGMMSQVGNTINNMMTPTSNNMNMQMPDIQPAWICSCGAVGQIGKFCNQCGSPKPEQEENNED